MRKEMRESKTLPLMTQITLILIDQAMLLVLSIPVWHWRPRQCALKAKTQPGRLCHTALFTICVIGVISGKVCRCVISEVSAQISRAAADPPCAALVLSAEAPADTGVSCSVLRKSPGSPTSLKSHSSHPRRKGGNCVRPDPPQTFRATPRSPSTPIYATPLPP